MQTAILTTLKEIEKTQRVKILLAVESGSRAWGFASPDSDYDVRFLYVRSREDYLRLDRPRDVLELPINNLLDVNGWDIDKALKLLYRSNPTLFEWLSSPIVYLETEYAATLRNAAEKYFVPKRALYHYHSMATGNYREYLKTDMVKAKKYFYVLRPILACKWILAHRSPPPMLFSELMDAELEPSLRPVVSELLELKINVPEVKQIPRIALLNTYLENSLTEIQAQISILPEERPNQWAGLNTLFLTALGSSCM